MAKLGVPLVGLFLVVDAAPRTRGYLGGIASAVLGRTVRGNREVPFAGDHRSRVFAVRGRSATRGGDGPGDRLHASPTLLPMW